ncbi:hypothetical protein AAFF_G00363220 [Aldrovandia affinis]|uniref:Uncharacterized protein n=1 Tax=Aldrovandia affinis TaxID=143900 RepID=A0AAD7R5I6_9TELE|nr:hypothetical protein AAFF_G00363220 [Aldrovandia affinis]
MFNALIAFVSLVTTRDSRNMSGHVYTLGILLIYQLCLATVKGLECQWRVHVNGTTSYHVSGVFLSGECSTEWSVSEMVIAHTDFNEDASKNEDMVETLTDRALTTKTCQENVLYKEVCPALGVSHSVPCSCNCSKADQHLEGNDSIELPNFEDQVCVTSYAAM